MFLPPYRFDLMAKYLYVKSKDKNLNTDFFKELYHKHLITFNGCKEYPDITVGERGITKTSIDAFINSFNILIENIKRYGYDNKYPIPIDKNGVIVNGIHRLITSYYYNVIPKTVSVNQIGNTGYNYRFFLNRIGNPVLEQLYADTMALEYIKHNKNMRCMVIYPVAFNMEKIIKICNIIDNYGYVYYHKIVNLNKNGVNNLIKEMYRGEDWIGGLFPYGWSPGGKAIRCIYNNNPVMLILISMNDINKCVELKEKCRGLYNLGKHSLHISDYISDTWRISSSLLNENSIHFLNNGTNDMSDNTKKLLEKYFNKNINRDEDEDEDYCLTSSLIMEMYGLRKAKDIDYLHRENKIIDINNIGIHDGKWLSYYGINKDDIIYNPINHLYLNGYKFASLEVIKKMKENRNEEKDKVDLELISKISI